MNILVQESFIKSVPKEKQKEVSNKMKSIIKLSESDIAAKKIPLGYKIEPIKSIKNKKIYKFRINSDDRILFTYGKHIDGIRDEFKMAMFILAFCKHDDQIRNAINIKLKNKDIIQSDILGYCNELVDNPNEGTKSNEQSINLTINNMLTIVSNEELLDNLFQDDSRNYYLDDIQIKAIEQVDEAKLIFGSAGSGKTTLSLYKILSLIQENEDIKICYITYSNVLKKETKDIFLKLAKEYFKIDSKRVESVSFYTLEEYINKDLNVNGVVNYESFNNWYCNIYLKYNKGIKYESIAVWKEIRGVITGLIGENLFNNVSIPNSILDRTGIFNLNKFEKILSTYIVATENDYFKFKESKSLYDLYREISRIDETYAKNISDDILDWYSKWLGINKIMTLEVYENLSKFSSVEKCERKKIYNIMEHYIKHIDNSENKLAISSLVIKEKINILNPIYDYLLIDEIQDLTEVEIFYLMTLVNNKKNMFFTGDFNQTINPTFFDAGRIEGIYKLYAGFNSLNKSTVIKRNYRCVKSIVDLSNTLIKKRNNIFANRNREFEYEEEWVKKSDNKVHYMEGNKKNLDLLMKNIEMDYTAKVIVNNNETKDKLKESYGFIEDRLYTINEIKGIESKKIVLYNIISDDIEHWRKILSLSKIENDSYRYYFNKLYVGITRAKENLCIFEDKRSEEVLKIIENDIEYCREFEESTVKHVSSIDEIFNEAKKTEKVENYINAIKIYKKLEGTPYGESASVAIKRCEILDKLNINKNSYEAIDNLINLGDIDKSMELAKYYNNKVLFLKSILLKEKDYTSNISIDDELMQSFNTTVDGILSTESENINYYDILLEKYYNNKLTRLSSLREETYKLTENMIKYQKRLEQI